MQIDKMTDRAQLQRMQEEEARYVNQDMVMELLCGLVLLSMYLVPSGSDLGYYASRGIAMGSAIGTVIAYGMLCHNAKRLQTIGARLMEIV